MNLLFVAYPRFPDTVHQRTGAHLIRLASSKQSNNLRSVPEGTADICRWQPAMSARLACNVYPTSYLCLRCLDYALLSAVGVFIRGHYQSIKINAFLSVHTWKEIL